MGTCNVTIPISPTMPMLVGVQESSLAFRSEERECDGCAVRSTCVQVMCEADDVDEASGMPRAWTTTSLAWEFQSTLCFLSIRMNASAAEGPRICNSYVMRYHSSSRHGPHKKIERPCCFPPLICHSPHRRHRHRPLPIISSLGISSIAPRSKSKID